MKKNQLCCFGALLLTAVLGNAVVGLAAPTSQPSPPVGATGASTASKADQAAYNAAINGFNKATQVYNSAKTENRPLDDANALIVKNIADLQAVAKLPSFQNDTAAQANLHNLIGYLYLIQNNPASAIPELQATVQGKPDNLDARNNLANALRQTNRYDEAAAQYRYILDHFEATPGLDQTRIKSNLATVLGQAGKTDEAITLFGQLAASNPDAATEMNYGFFLQKAGRNAEAADAFQKAADQNPKDAVAWLSAGELYAKSQRPDDAITALTHAVGPDVDPKLDSVGQYNAYFALGEAHTAKGDINQGIKDFDTAAKIQPENAVPIYNKGVLQEQAGLKSDAEASYRSAHQRDPSNVQIQIALGLLLASEGNAADSIPLLAEGVAKLPQDAKAAPIYARLGDQYAKQRDFANAQQARRQALALNPDDADTHLALAQSDMAQKQYAGALAEYNAAAKLRPSDPAIQAQRGVIYKNLKQYPKALAAFKQSLALDTGNAEVQNNIGVLYELLGSKAQAIIAYKKALALNPNLTVARQNLQRFAKK